VERGGGFLKRKGGVGGGGGAWHGRTRTVQPVAGGRVRAVTVLLCCLLASSCRGRSRSGSASGEIKEKADGGGEGWGREGKESERKRWSGDAAPARCAWRGLAERHGRVLLQLPGFAVPAPDPVAPRCAAAPLPGSRGHPGRPHLAPIFAQSDLPLKEVASISTLDQ
jgi:hypothetical protein